MNVCMPQVAAVVLYMIPLRTIMATISRLAPLPDLRRRPKVSNVAVKDMKLSP